MTIDELLKLAGYMCGDAAKEAQDSNGSWAMAEVYANVAQACAQTAQAMMASEARQEWLEQRAADYATDVDDYRVTSH